MSQIDETKPIGYLAKDKPVVWVGIILIVLPFFFLAVEILLFELLLDMFWGDSLLYYGIGTAVATIFSLPGIMLVQNGRKLKQSFKSLVLNGTVVQGEVVDQTQTRIRSRNSGLSAFSVKITYTFQKPNALMPGSRQVTDWVELCTRNPSKAAEDYKPGTIVDVLYHGESSVILTQYTRTQEREKAHETLRP